MTGNQQPAAELSKVSYRFGTTKALSDVSLTVEAGEVVALLGPNGAGKTTAIDLFLGLRQPHSGAVRLLGRNPRDPTARLGIGATPQETDFPPHLTVEEVLNLVCAHYPNPIPAKELLARFGLNELSRRQTGGLSGGQARRLAVALAFAGRGQIVFLDEPTTGLDVAARREVWREVRKYVAAGGTLFLTTHYLEEAEALATKVVLIDQGRVQLQGSVAEIKSLVGIKRVRFRANKPPTTLKGVYVEKADDLFTLHTPDADAFVRGLVEQEIPFHDLEVLPVNLEEAFLSALEKGEGS